MRPFRTTYRNMCADYAAQYNIKSLKLSVDLKNKDFKFDYIHC